jgi:hypothetical protein
MVTKAKQLSKANAAAAERLMKKIIEETEPIKPVDFTQVRKNIAALVGHSAEAIAKSLIIVATKGQLAPAKYLFEAVGLYPLTAETSPQEEESLAFTLLQRLGLPTDPVFGEDGAPRWEGFGDAVQGRDEDSGEKEGESSKL